MYEQLNVFYVVSSVYYHWDNTWKVWDMFLVRLYGTHTPIIYKMHSGWATLFLTGYASYFTLILILLWPGYMMLHQAIFIPRFLVHFAITFLIPKSQLFWGSAFVAPDIPVNFNCVTWIFWNMTESHLKLGKWPVFVGSCWWLCLQKFMVTIHGLFPFSAWL